MCKISMPTIISGVLAFVASMLPINYMPPLYANNGFMLRLLGSSDLINSYIYSYLLGFLIFGVLALNGSRVFISSKYDRHIYFFMVVATFSSISIPNPYISIISRVISGALGCALYIRVYSLISYSPERKIHLVGKIIGISSIILESLSLISGVLSNYTSDTFIKFSYMFILMTLFMFYIFYRDIDELPPLDKSTYRVHNKYLSIIMVFPSIMAFTAFFIFLTNVGSSSKIPSFFIGLIVFSLAFVFPQGTFLSNKIVIKIGRKQSLMIFTIFSILGVLIQTIGIRYSSWPLLMIGACLVALGNGGIITINSGDSMDSYRNDPARPTLQYILISMLLTTILGVINRFTICYSYIMLFLYIAIFIYILFYDGRQKVNQLKY